MGMLINLMWVTFFPLSEQVQTLPLLFASHTASPPSSLSSQVFLSKAMLPAVIMQWFFHCSGIKNILSLWLECIPLLEFVSTSKAHFLFCTVFLLYYLTCCYHCFHILLAKAAPKMLFYLPLISFLVWLFIQVGQEPCSADSLTLLGDSRCFLFYWGCTFKAFSVILLQTFCSHWLYNCFHW